MNKVVHTKAVTLMLTASVMLLLIVWLNITVPVWMIPSIIFLKNPSVKALLFLRIFCT